MAARVYLHIGLPKTATTYLQTILWANREALERPGRLGCPGRSAATHLWASRIIREDPEFEKVERAPARARGSACAPTSPQWPGTAIDQPRVLRRRLDRAGRPDGRRPGARRGPPRRHRPGAAGAVHRQLAGEHQEPRHHGRWPTTPAPSRPRAPAIWNWRTLDIHRVLERWSPAFPRERVHVLPLPGPEAPQAEIWDRFAGLIGVDPDSVDLTQSFPNASMGVVEAETLRRINAHLGDVPAPPSTAAPTSAPSSPTSGWCRARATRSGRTRSGSRRCRRARAGRGRLHRRPGLPRDRRPRRRCSCPTSWRRGGRRSRSPTARSPRWRWSWRHGCCTTSATCGTSGASCVRSSPRRRRARQAQETRACASGSRGGSRCCGTCCVRGGSEHARRT